MAFPKPPNDTPVSVGIIEITLLDFPAVEGDFPSPARKEARFRMELKNAAGMTVRVLDGDLIPHLAAQQISGLISFVDDMRTKSLEALP